jgi:hypothetical protein
MMRHGKTKKTPRFSLLGYGAMALYASSIAAMALAVYGFNVTSMVMSQNSSERARAQVQHGRMLVTTEDRVQCRSIRFNNETAELSSETLSECDTRAGDRSSGGSFSVFHDGFVNR